MAKPPVPDWSRIRAVVFDIDGTLYDSAPVRRRMALELIAHCAGDPRRVALLRLLQTFRAARESLADEEAANVATLQYERPAAALGVSEEAVERAVRIWILTRPLRHLRRFRVAGTGRFFERLRASGRKIAVLSDYPTAAKLAALDLDADVEVAATDPGVGRLKPHPAGLERTLELLAAAPGECLVIGDRDDRDGTIARRLGTPFLLRARSAGSRSGRLADYVDLAAALPD